MPAIDDLGLVHHIPADIAFFMTRPTIRSAISVSGVGSACCVLGSTLNVLFIQAKFSELEKGVKSESEKQDRKTKVSQQEVCQCVALIQVLQYFFSLSRVAITLLVLT